MTTTENIVIGVISGLLTASVLLMLKSLLQNTAIPWYRTLLYKGIKIDGAWYQFSNEQKVLLELTQQCESLSGKATILDLSQDDEHYDNLKTYDIQGYISERFLVLNYTHTDQKRIGHISELLQVDGDGAIISGQATWYAPRASKIISGESKYYRSEEAAKKCYGKLIHEAGNSADGKTPISQG